MKTIFKTLFVLFVVGCLAVNVIGVAGLGLLAAKDHGFSVQSPIVVAIEEQVQAPVESNPTQVSPAVENPAQPNLPVDSVTDFYGQACQLYGALIISPEEDWKVTVVESNGRIWQPCLPEEKDRPAFESSFTGRATGEFTFHGINATLWQDTDKDGTPDKVLAEKVGSKVVSIEAGGWYKVVHGAHNGGFDLVPLQ